jgi:hypothetical protein
MRFFDHVPLVLVFVPIVLMAFDVGFKWRMFKAPPYDSVADIGLAALTFSMVHLCTLFFSGGGRGVPAIGWAFLWCGAQFLAWPAFLLWSVWLHENPITRRLVPSYFVGIAWFMLSTGQVLRFST